MSDDSNKHTCPKTSSAQLLPGSSPSSHDDVVVNEERFTTAAATTTTTSAPVIATAAAAAATAITNALDNGSDPPASHDTLAAGMIDPGPSNVDNVTRFVYTVPIDDVGDVLPSQSGPVIATTAAAMNAPPHVSDPASAAVLTPLAAAQDNERMLDGVSLFPANIASPDTTTAMNAPHVSDPAASATVLIPLAAQGNKRMHTTAPSTTLNIDDVSLSNANTHPFASPATLSQRPSSPAPAANVRLPAPPATAAGLAAQKAALDCGEMMMMDIDDPSQQQPFMPSLPPGLPLQPSPSLSLAPDDVSIDKSPTPTTEQPIAKRLRARPNHDSAAAASVSQQQQASKRRRIHDAAQIDHTVSSSGGGGGDDDDDDEHKSSNAEVAALHNHSSDSNNATDSDEDVENDEEKSSADSPPRIQAEDVENDEEKSSADSPPCIQAKTLTQLGATFTFRHKAKRGGIGSKLEIRYLHKSKCKFVDELSIAKEDKMKHFWQFEFSVTRLIHGSSGRNRGLVAVLEVESAALSSLPPRQMSARLDSHGEGSWECLKGLDMFDWLCTQCKADGGTKDVAIPEDLGVTTVCLSGSPIAVVVVEPGVFDHEVGPCPIGGLFQHSFALSQQSDRLHIVAGSKERPPSAKVALKRISKLLPSKLKTSILTIVCHSDSAGNVNFRYSNLPDRTVVHPVVIGCIPYLTAFLRQVQRGTKVVVFTCGNMSHKHREAISKLSSKFGCFILMTSTNINHRAKVDNPVSPLPPFILDILDSLEGQPLQPEHVVRFFPSSTVRRACHFELHRPDQAVVRINDYKADSSSSDSESAAAVPMEIDEEEVPRPVAPVASPPVITPPVIASAMAAAAVVIPPTLAIACATPVVVPPTLAIVTDIVATAAAAAVPATTIKRRKTVVRRKTVFRKLNKVESVGPIYSLSTATASRMLSKRALWFKADVVELGKYTIAFVCNGMQEGDQSWKTFSNNIDRVMDENDPCERFHIDQSDMDQLFRLSKHTIVQPGTSYKVYAFPGH